MSSDWPLVPVGEVAQLFDGPHATPKKTENGPVFLGISSLKRGLLDLSSTEHLSEEDFSKWTRRVTPQVGDVVFSYETRIGEVAIIPEGLRCCLGRRMALLRPDQRRLLPKYLLYYFLSDEFQGLLRTRTIHGSTVDRLPLKDFPSYPVRVPPLGVQRSISEILEALDQRKSLLRETNATLEAVAQALFKSWFVDFDPVRAKAEGRQPEGMDAATASLFPDSFEESELGLVPRGWQHSCVEEFAEKVGMGPFGSNIKVETFVSDGVPVISGQHLRQTLVEDSTFNFITDRHAEKLSNSCVFEGDVIFTHAGSIGQVALLHRYAQFERYVLSQRQFFLRCDKQKMRPEWITYYFRSTQGQHQLLANTSQVGVPSIARPVSYLRSIKVVMPPKALVDRFSDIADSTHQVVLTNRKQIQTLTHLRDTLLPRLISGQLRLPGAEQAVEEALA